MAASHTGSCLCGAVRFTVADALTPAAACHCSMCRKQTGLFYCSTEVASAALTVTGGEQVTWYRSSERARRGFCAHCGSALFWQDQRRHRISVLMGAFDGKTGVKVGRHIFVEEEGDFYEMRDGHAIV